MILAILIIGLMAGTMAPPTFSSSRLPLSRGWLYSRAEAAILAASAATHQNQRTRSPSRAHSGGIRIKTNQRGDLLYVLYPASRTPVASEAQ